jgi:hypothetical protein
MSSTTPSRPSARNNLSFATPTRPVLLLDQTGLAFAVLMSMLEQLKKIGRYVITYKDPYAPDKQRRAQVIQQLSQRPSLSNEEWYRRFAADKNIPLYFVSWFRDTCSKYFEYDLSAALPDDRLVEDLGLFEATWGDTDWDIFEEYSGEFGCNWPKCEGMKTIATFGDMRTFGKFLETLWTHAQQHAGVNQSPPKL